MLKAQTIKIWFTKTMLTKQNRDKKRALKRFSFSSIYTKQTFNIYKNVTKLSMKHKILLTSEGFDGILKIVFDVGKRQSEGNDLRRGEACAFGLLLSLFFAKYE